MLAVGVAIVQFWPEYTWIAAVAVVFFVGQFIEGNILQPRLVGKSVGLHPVWLMFALVAFGALFGFVGLMIAVPAAAAVGVLVRFGLSRYLDTVSYTHLDVYKRQCFGSTRGMFSGKPPPVMCASALIAPVSRIAFSSGFT